MKGPFKKARVLIIDFARTKSVSEDDLGGRIIYATDLLPVMIDGNLNNVVLTGGKISTSLYLKLTLQLGLDRARRPLKFSLINCDIVHSKDYRESVQCKISTRFDFLHFWSEKFKAMPIPRWSIQLPMDGETFYEQLVLMFRKLVFPYSRTQIDWLENCLVTVRNLERNLAGSSDPLERPLVYHFIMQTRNFDF